MTPAKMEEKYPSMSIQRNMFQAPDGKFSMSRLIAFVGLIAGVAALVVGSWIALSGATSNPVNKDIAGVGKDIFVAGLGVFTTGALTKIGNGIAEAVRFKGR